MQKIRDTLTNFKQHYEENKQTKADKRHVNRLGRTLRRPSAPERLTDFINRFIRTVSDVLRRFSK